ncbi:integrase arm-type DNA-binding domain-containing protein [Desulfuromonas thiophila]|uniref:tyrosine-type recombinase/integrase n=1 Tax=Desulfuromonas thiophila TaxID=57664 RepID=UPI0029F5C8EB|nr:integrase arm-type DNA-binding domain-containing protein [Desulfuromonas thiophila]
MKSVLTDLQIRKAKPKDKAYKIADGGGMYLYITPVGSKLWRMKYRFGGKEKTLSLGKYPVVSLERAREKRLEAKRLLDEGVDPGQAQEAPQVPTFRDLATLWYEEKKPTWSEKHADRLWGRLVRDVYPHLGDTPITQVSAEDIEITLKRIAKRSLDTAHRLKAALRGTLNYAIRKGHIQTNYIEALKGVIPHPRHRHMPAPTDPAKVGQLLRDIDAYPGSFVVCCALRLAPLVFVRPGELRKAEWSEIDLERAVWEIPAEKMKMRNAHLVPLSKQALRILEMIRPLSGGERFVFPGRSRELQPISEAAINTALKKLGYKDQATGHGFRAMARTLIHERLRYSPDAIEAQLAHAVPDRLGNAYNRAIHWEERVELMQAWADYLDELKAQAGSVNPFA